MFTARQFAKYIGLPLLGLAVVAVGILAATSSRSVAGTPVAAADTAAAVKHTGALQEARTTCSPDTGSMGALTESHDGQVTLVIDGVGVDDTGYEDPTAEWAAVTCILADLDAPAAVTARMGDTRALDGMQDAEWGVYHATWTFHPDDGMNLVLTEG